MKSLILLLALAAAASAQLSNAWFPLSIGGGVGYSGSAISNQTPAADIVNNGLSINLVHQTTASGNSQAAPANAEYTSGIIFWNDASFTYGNFVVSLQMPSTLNSDTYAAVWLTGVTGGHGTNCQIQWRTTLVTSDCLPAPAGYAEIDVAEEAGPTTVNQQIHVPGHNDGGQTSVPTFSTAQNVYEADWTPGSVVFYINGTNSVNIGAAYVPSTPQFALVQTGVNTGAVSGNYPSSLKVNYIRVCPTSTPAGGCTKAIAAAAMTSCANTWPCTGFDEEFNETGAQSAIYVANGYTGNQDGSSCANAYGALNYLTPQWPNDTGIWAAGIIGPGTIINVCPGTTTALTAYGSGASGNPVTYNLMPGAVSTVNTNSHSYVGVTIPKGSGAGGIGGAGTQ